MGVFRRTLTAQSSHRARQDERLRLKSIQIVIFLENNWIRPFFLGWDHLEPFEAALKQWVSFTNNCVRFSYLYAHLNFS